MPVTYQREKPMKCIPSPKWFLACYVRDVYSRLDLLKAAATSVYGKVLKIDSTKKVTRKLQGVEAESANWVTNVGNERGEIVISVLTASESTSSLKPMAEGLVKRYATAGEAAPLILYTDRDWCGCQDQSRFNALFSSWPNMVVRLDIFHFMRHLAAGCNSESHPLYSVLMGSLARCIFEWDGDDLALLPGSLFFLLHYLLKELQLGVIIDYEVRSWASTISSLYIYKQEDVKANLLNPKSEQHLICGCIKKHECREEKEI